MQLQGQYHTSCLQHHLGQRKYPHFHQEGLYQFFRESKGNIILIEFLCTKHKAHLNISRVARIHQCLSKSLATVSTKKVTTNRCRSLIRNNRTCAVKPSIIVNKLFAQNCRSCYWLKNRTWSIRIAYSLISPLLSKSITCCLVLFIFWKTFYFFLVFHQQYQMGRSGQRSPQQPFLKPHQS